MTQHYFEQFAKVKTCSLCGVEKEFNERYNTWDYTKWTIPKPLRNKKTVRCDQVWDIRRKAKYKLQSLLTSPKATEKEIELTKLDLMIRCSGRCRWE